MKTKSDIINEDNTSDHLSTAFEKMKGENQGFKVPDGYFNTLSPRIMDNIKKRENKTLFSEIILRISKPIVWTPAIITVVVALLLIFVVPEKKESSVNTYDEWSEINMAYDASYAEEVLLAESNNIDTELDKNAVNGLESIALSAVEEPADEEIIDYLNKQEIETEVLIEN